MVDRKVITQILIIVAMIAVTAIIISTVLTNNVKICNENSPLQNNLEDTLILTQVIFRHGDRTPEPGKLYRLDPYNNYSFYPYNFGELTTKGKKKAYELGKLLRQRYDTFLGTEFHPKMVKSFVSGYDRTQMSLQCVHAGLFPHKNSILGIPWRPITYEIFNFDEDNKIGIMSHCNKLPNVTPIDAKTINLFQYLSTKSGDNVSVYIDVAKIANAFHVETSYGLEIPDWGKELYPEPLRTLENIAWNHFITQNIRYGVGGMIKMITEIAIQSTYDETIIKPKIVLYSGHDYNLKFLQSCLNISDFITPEFSAFIMFELHRIEGVYGFKVYYNNYKQGHPKLLKIPFCMNSYNDGSFCRLDVFILHTRWFYDPTPICGL